MVCYDMSDTAGHTGDCSWMRSVPRPYSKSDLVELLIVV